MIGTLNASFRFQVCSFTSKLVAWGRQDALSQRDCAAECIILFAKRGRLELGDNILLTL